MAKAKKKTQKNKSTVLKGLMIILLGVILLVTVVLRASLWKDYPVQSDKALLSISNGDNYSLQNSALFLFSRELYWDS